MSIREKLTALFEKVLELNTGELIPCGQYKALTAEEIADEFIANGVTFKTLYQEKGE